MAYAGSSFSSLTIAAAAAAAMLSMHLAPARGAAQTAGAEPTKVSLVLGGTAAPALTRVDGGDINSVIDFDPLIGAEIVIQCKDAVKCSDVSGAVEGQDGTLSRSAVTGNARTIVVPRQPGATKQFPVTIRLGSMAIAPTLVFRPRTAETNDVPAAGGPSANDLAMLNCGPRPLTLTGDFVFDARGNLLAAPSRTLNEGDTVSVVIFADRRLHDQLRVRRSSATRPVTVSRILGEGTTAADLTRQRRDTTAPRCVSLEYLMSDFASGEGKFDVAALGSGTATTLYEYTFKVNALYTGVLAFGPIWTTLRDYAFTKVYNGQDTVVSRSPKKAGRVAYAVTYTPFVWGPRDVTVAPAFKHRFNPFVGAALNDVQKNAFVGVNVELPARLYLSYGLHAGRVTVLDSASGAKVGAAFENRAADVPTQQRWSFKPFVGVSVDVLAAVELLRAAASAPK